jgi:hypothetical protein
MEGGLSGHRRKGVSGILGGVGKFSVWLVVAEEKGKKVAKRGEKKLGKKADFFLKFGPRFLPLQCLESTSIYRWWKSDTLSLLGTNLGPCFNREGFQPLTQRCHGLSKWAVKGYLS